MPDPSLLDKPTRVRWLVFVLACAASWVLYLHRYSWGVIKPAFRKEHPELSDTEIGWLDSAFQATYALGQVPGGFLGDLLGARAVLPAIVVLWSVAVVGVAWTAGFGGLFGFRALFGFAQAGAYPIISKMTRNWFPLSVRSSVQGMVTAMGRAGAACCPLILASLLMGLLGLSWQDSLLLLMVPGLALAVALWIVVRNSPREHPWANQAEKDEMSPPAADAGRFSGEPAPPIVYNRASMLSLGMMLLYAFASTFQDQLYVNWIPLFLVEGHGMSAGEMGLFTPLPLVGGAIGGILGGVLNDYLIRRTGNRRWARAGVAIAGKAVQAALVLVAVQVWDGRVAMMVLLVARVFGDWSLTSQWGAITDMGGRAAATLFGLVNTLGAIGGFVAGPALGALKQHYGWEGLFGGVAAMCLLAAITWVFIDCTKRLAAD
jgi:sugar phosphate permease